MFFFSPLCLLTASYYYCSSWLQTFSSHCHFVICLKPSYIESYKEKGFTARQMFGIQEIQRTEEQKTMNKKTEK